MTVVPAVISPGFDVLVQTSYAPSLVVSEYSFHLGKHLRQEDLLGKFLVKDVDPAVMIKNIRVCAPVVHRNFQILIVSHPEHRLDFS